MVADSNLFDRYAYQSELTGSVPHSSVGTMLDGFKECWEAVTIWAFLQLMYLYMGIDSHGIVNLKIRVPTKLRGKRLELTAPLNWVASDPTFDHQNAVWLVRCVKQFMFLNPVLYLFTVVAQISGYADEIWIWLPVAIVANISVTLALNAMIMFYHAFEETLAKENHRPLAKFLSFKGVVFFASWQSIILQGIIYYEGIEHGEYLTATQKGKVLTDVLCCVEMCFIFAPVYIYSFPPPGSTSPYHKPKRRHH